MKGLSEQMEVMALEPKYRLAVYLYYYEGLSVADITDELKMNGRYDYEDTTDAGTYLTVAVEGWVDDWTAAVTIGGGETDGTVYKYTKGSDGNEIVVTERPEGKGMENIEITTSTYQSDGKTVTQK